MGQQQLLLLVLGIVIVGLAVVVGIQSFQENKIKTKQDNYTETGVALMGDVIAWYQKPVANGGGGGSGAGFTSLYLRQLGSAQDYSDANRSGIHTNGIGRYLYRFANPMIQVHTHPIAIGSEIIEVMAFGPRPECIVSQRGRYGMGWTSWDGNPPANPNAGLCTW